MISKLTKQKIMYPFLLAKKKLLQKLLNIKKIKKLNIVLYRLLYQMFIKLLKKI